MLRLLNLPKDISNQVKEGALSSAHGRTLLGIKDVTMMKKISQQAIRENWSVRYLEQVVNELQDCGQSKNKAPTQIKPKFIQKQERRLKEKFGSKVDISTSKNIGKITFEFKTEEEFKRLIQNSMTKYDT